MATKKVPAIEKPARASRAAATVPDKEVAKTSKEAGVKIPKSLAACADMLYEMERRRYVLQKEVDAMKSAETAIREHLINNLPKSDALGIAGKIARATIKEKEIVELVGSETDRFEKVYDFILKNGRKNPGVWSLLQRRLGEAAAKELIDAGKGALIGAKLGKVPTVSLTKV